MSRKPRLYLAFAAVVALMAAVPAMSSAATFKWSATGSYGTKALGAQVLTFKEGPYGFVKCSDAQGSGTLNSFDFSTFDLTVTYSKCSAFTAAAKLSPVTYRYHADGGLDVVSPLTITASVLGLSCTVTVPSQSNLTAVNYANNGNKVKVENAVNGITFSSSGGFCPSSGTNATLTGLNELERIGGGSVSWEP